MSIIQSIELFTAINLGIVGLSHFLQPGMWVEFFQFLSTKKHVGNIFNALLTLGVGSIILSFHFIWSWPKILITVYLTNLVRFENLTISNKIINRTHEYLPFYIYPLLYLLMFTVIP